MVSLRRAEQTAPVRGEEIEPVRRGFVFDPVANIDGCVGQRRGVDITRALRCSSRIRTDKNNDAPRARVGQRARDFGDLGFAIGYENRKEQGGFSPDAIAQTGDSTNLASGNTYGRYTLDEFYAELSIPILADGAFAKELTLNVASRYSDYDSFGDTTNNKFGFKWRPFDDLLIRGTVADGFRAPTITDLYGGGSQTFTTNFSDPCDSVYGAARGSARCLQDVAANYRQLKQGFVPVDSEADQTPVPFTSGSNPSRQPELAKSKTVGFVYSPGYVQGLTVGLDWWNIKITDTVVSDSPNQILRDCYIAGIESRCNNFSRDPVLGIVTDLTYGTRNAGYTETEGGDLDVRATG